MSALSQLKKKLRPGQVYRRRDLKRWSNAVDRHLQQLLEEGRLEKVGPSLYLAPRQTRFGTAPADPQKLIKAFLGDDRFLVVSPNTYNTLGVGTTQLYNEAIVYNRKRHGRFELDGRTYDFRRRTAFPAKLTKEALFVDLLKNLNELAEDRDAVERHVLKEAPNLDRNALLRAMRGFNSSRVNRLLEPVLGEGDSTGAKAAA